MTWKLAMPAAENWQQLTDQLDVAEPTIDHETGEGMVILEGSGTGMRWKFDMDMLERVASVLGVKFTVRVGDPREFIHGYGNITYAQVKFNYLPMLHDDKSPGTFAYVISVYPMLSPEAANYCIWHEIQHIFQFEEMRAHPMKMDYNPNLPMLGDNVEKYMKDPTETDADAMALKLHQLGQYQVVRTISWLEGTEGEEYAMLVHDEGWPPDEAAEEVQQQIKTNEIPLSTVMETRGLEPLEAPISKVAMPYYNNTWYHVTSVNNLDNIAQQGLVPRIEGGQSTNWPYAGVPNNAIYFWPSISMARSYFQHLNFPDKGKHVILRVRNLDLTKLAPDHEEFARWLEERWENDTNWPNVDPEELNMLYNQVLSQSETANDIAQDPNDNSFSDQQALQILSELHPDLRMKLAEELAETGEPVMYYGTVPPEQIDVASLLTYEQLMEQFDEEHSDHPYLKWDDERTDEEQDAQEEDYHEKLDQYLADIMEEQQIHEFVAIEDIEKMIENSVDDTEDQYAEQFAYKPLQQWTMQPQTPEYGDYSVPTYL